uniref:Uncharacterized protein n=2 Tax=Populus TaxID=3689 RepID=A0A3N7EKG7_POPTR
MWWILYGLSWVARDKSLKIMIRCQNSDASLQFTNPVFIHTRTKNSDYCKQHLYAVTLVC